MGGGFVHGDGVCGSDSGVHAVAAAPKGFDWTTVFLFSICSGSLGTVFVGLGIMWVKHRLMKKKWREQNPRRRRRNRQQSRKTRVEEYIQQQKENVECQLPLEECTREERESILPMTTTTTTMTPPWIRPWLLHVSEDIIPIKKLFVFFLIIGGERLSSVFYY